MTLRLITTLVLVSFVSQACKEKASHPSKAVEAEAPAAAGQAVEDMPKPLVEPVLTREQRDKLTVDEIVESLRAGNRRFATGDLTVRDHTAQVRAAATGQFPKAVVLSCLDSRVPVEDVFDRGIGDLFVARVAGNFENPDILGSIEFATKVAGAKVVLVLGHEYCGAVKGAVDGVELGNITPMLENIQPAVQAFSSYQGDRSSKNPEFVHMVAEENVRRTVEEIRQRSVIVRELEDAGSLKILGAMYDMDTGEVQFLD